MNRPSRRAWARSAAFSLLALPATLLAQGSGPGATAPSPPAPVAATAAPTPQTPDVQAGRTAAEAWLARLDTGDFAGTWREAAPPFQAAVDAAKWTSGMGDVRKPFGRMLSRRLLVARFSTTMPGGPTGRYVFLQYQTDFENKKGAIETIVPMLDTDGRWKISGYYIK